jgi:hypothetical protein
MHRFYCSTILCVLGVLLTPAHGHADIIAQSVPAGPIYASLGDSEEGVFWTQTGTYTDVSISAYLGSSGFDGDGSGTVYLTNAIGPGATMANEIAQISLSGLASAPAPATNLFSGLTLGPGTYYLNSSSESSPGLAWELFYPVVHNIAAGGSIGEELNFGMLPTDFPPSASLTPQANNFAFSVTGTPETVPEPSSVPLLLTIIGGVGLGLRVRTRTRNIS